MFSFLFNCIVQNNYIAQYRLRKSMNQRIHILAIVLIVCISPIVNAAISINENLQDVYDLNVEANNTLTLTYNGVNKYYTLDDLLGFDSITGNGGRLKVTGDVSGPFRYTGIVIQRLAQEFSSLSSRYSLIAIADDGYVLKYSYDQILGNIMVYDEEGDEIGVGGVSMILATMESGETDYPGSYRIAYINQDEPFTDAALWAKYVIELEFIDESSDTIPPIVNIEKPSNKLYLFDKEIVSYSQPFIIGGITIRVNAYDDSGISRVIFMIDEKLKYEGISPPYQWFWDETAIGKYTIEIIAYDIAGNVAKSTKNVLIINP